MLLWQAWHVAAFNRAKRLPELDSLLRKFGKVKPQSTKSMIAVAEQSLAMFGGKDKRKK